MYGAQIAFKRYVAAVGIWGSPWVGFDHFRRFFNSYEFWIILKNTLGLSLYDLIAGTPLPILLALCLNYVRLAWFKKSVQLVTFAPHFISVVVMVGMTLQFLDPRIGLVNNILGTLGVEPVNFMAKPEFFKSVYVWSGMWQNTGFACVIYLAALAGVDPALHEAAVVDGANKFQRSWHIDLPGILPVAVILLILSAGSLLNNSFEKVLLLQNPLNLTSSEVIDTYVYKIGLNSGVSNFSYATAIGLFKSGVSLILLVLVNRLARSARQATLW